VYRAFVIVRAVSKGNSTIELGAAEAQDVDARGVRRVHEDEYVPARLR
jgi:hypothetical protein